MQSPSCVQHMNAPPNKLMQLQQTAAPICVPESLEIRFVATCVHPSLFASAASHGLSRLPQPTAHNVWVALCVLRAARHTLHATQAERLRATITRTSTTTMLHNYCNTPTTSITHTLASNVLPPPLPSNARDAQCTSATSVRRYRCHLCVAAVNMPSLYFGFCLATTSNYRR